MNSNLKLSIKSTQVNFPYGNPSDNLNLPYLQEHIVSNLHKCILKQL